MKRIFSLAAISLAVLATGCTRIETGEVGVRVGFDKEVKQGELLPGSFNQTLIGDVLTFPIKDVAVAVENIKEAPESKSVPSVWKCEACGHENSVDKKVCSYCGQLRSDLLNKVLEQW